MLVVSPDDLNGSLRTVVVAPMTSKGFPAPFRVALTHGGTKGLVLLDQIRTVDKARLVKKSGTASAKTQASALAVLQAMFAL